MPKDKKSPDTASDDQEVTETVQQDDENWQERYKGMQRAFNKKSEELDNLAEKFENLMEESETSKATEGELQKQLQDIQKQMDERQQELDQMTGQIAAQEAKQKRTNLILSEFPDLAPFEAKGLLPDVPDDQMKDKFNEFREVFQSRVEDDVKKQVVGASAAETGGDGTHKVTRSKEQIYGELMRLAGSTNPEDRARREALVAEWDEAVTKAATT